MQVLLSYFGTLQSLVESKMKTGQNKLQIEFIQRVCYNNFGLRGEKGPAVYATKSLINFQADFNR